MQQALQKLDKDGPVDSALGHQAKPAIQVALKHRVALGQSLANRCTTAI
jgi:hypothetical protein